MMKAQIAKVDVTTKKVSKVTDYVAEESPLLVFLNRTHYATIFCSPSNLKELAIGHSLSEGIIKSTQEIEEVTFKDGDVCRVKLKSTVDLEKRLKLWKSFSRIIFSACGGQPVYMSRLKISKIKSSLSVKAETILNSVNRLNSIAEIFRKTGGVHVAALYKGNGDLIGFSEDVGRHNAVDKAIGIGALQEADFSECFLALSGRLSGDVVLKAARVGLPIVASLAAALDSGIKIAADAELTLVGFVRGGRLNIYTFPKRILS
jgi:FdhD protein